MSNTSHFMWMASMVVVLVLVVGYRVGAENRERAEARKEIQHTVESMLELRTDSLVYLLEECELHKNVSCALRVAESTDETKPTPLIIVVQYFNSRGMKLVESQLRLVQGQRMEVIQAPY